VQYGGLQKWIRSQFAKVDHELEQMILLLWENLSSEKFVFINGSTHEGFVS